MFVKKGKRFKSKDNKELNKHSKKASSKSNNNCKPKKKKIVLFISILLFVVPIIYFLYNFNDIRNSNQIAKKIVETSNVFEEILDGLPPESENLNPSDYSTFLSYLNVDFKSLLSKNKDTVRLVKSKWNKYKLSSSTNW